MCMKKVLFIVFAILITNVSVFAADYNRYGTQSNIAKPSGCQECRRVRKRFAKPQTRFAQPRPYQKAGYYKTGMNIYVVNISANVSYNLLGSIKIMQLAKLQKHLAMVLLSMAKTIFASK